MKENGRLALPTKRWVESPQNRVEPCAINADAQQVARSGRAGDIAVGMTSTAWVSEDFGQSAFRLRHDPMKRKACGWTVNCTVPLRETRSTRAPTVRLEVVAACRFDPRRDDHLGSTFVRDFMSPSDK